MSTRKPTRTAGVYKKDRKRGPVYEARYRTKDGGQVGKTFSSLEEAEAFLVEQKHDVLRGTHVSKVAASTPWTTVAQQWMGSKRIEGRKARTLKGYQHILDSWCSDWDDWPVGSIKTADVQALVERMVDEGRSPQTVRNVFNVVRGVFDYALNVAGYVSQNPALALSRRLPARASAHTPRFLSAAEVNLLAGQMERDADALLVRFAAWSGLRAGEIAGLRVQSLDVLRAKVRVVETVVALKGELRVDTPKSKKSRREVPIPPMLARLLAEHVAARGLGPRDYVFGTGLSPLNYAKWYLGTFLPAAKSAGLSPMRFHDLRHTYASLMHAQGRSMLEVSRWMGHSTFAITADIYSHVWEDEDGTLGAALDAAFGSATTRSVVLPLAKVAH